MSHHREVVVLSACRTAIGTFGGSFKDVPVSELATTAIKEAIARSKIDAASFGHVVVGHVVHNEPKDAYLSRVAAMNAGLPKEVCAMNVNRLCGSGLQAVVSASQSILLGDTDFAIGAGAENMSRTPMWMPAARWGMRMGDAKVVDPMTGALHDPFQTIHMGVTAENVATQCGITREQQDALAVESHRRAAAAINAGYFKDQIVPFELKSKKGPIQFVTDEHVRMDATLEDMTKLKPVFLKENGTVTAGNASGINDAAAAVVLADLHAAEKAGAKPMARLIAYAHAGVEPRTMGLGPVPATKKALAKAGLTLDQMDVVESNEAFAAQALGVAKELGFNAAKTNPNGSGISLGHPIGATGCILTVKAIYELHRTGGKYALVTMCIGGGQGIAAIFERM
jgi:acetyl-CoA C-acetyltransferase